eukprot:3748227-Rhodomonas_salina.1
MLAPAPLPLRRSWRLALAHERHVCCDEAKQTRAPRIQEQMFKENEETMDTAAQAGPQAHCTHIKLIRSMQKDRPCARFCLMSSDTGRAQAGFRLL